MNIFKIIILMLFFLSCEKTEVVKKIQINKTQKIKIQKKWESKHRISYLWSKPEGPDNHQSTWIVNQNVMLFTPDRAGDYKVVVSIETSMGEILGQEKFYYEVINTENHVDNYDKVNTKITTNQKEQVDGYTIQISSWNKFEDAKDAMNDLNNLNLNSYIDEEIINNQTWYRVRIGENISYPECIKIKNKLNKMLIKNIWIDKYHLKK